MSTWPAIHRAPIRFGTDGWRAVISDEFTFNNLERVSQAYANYLNNVDGQAFEDNVKQASQSCGRSPVVVIGYDGRFLSEKFARRTAEVLAGNGIRVALFDAVTPTPLVSWAVREESAAGGVVITASHNPAEFNGFKIKASWGGSAPPELTRSVESLVDLEAPQTTDITRWCDPELIVRATQTFRVHVGTLVDLGLICKSKHRVTLDPMHGAAGRWVESFLESGNIAAETIRSERDPMFGGVNPEPIDKNLGALKSRVLMSGAVLGLATDGDADRLGAVNELGETMPMHQIVPLLLLYLIRNRKMTGSVVTTFSQSVLIKRIAAAYNLTLHETPIGFKYVADFMLRENVLLGAEESGGIGVQGHIPERDGIVNSLLVLEAVIAAGKPPSEMVADIHREFGEFHFDRRDLQMAVDRGQEFVKRLTDDPPAAVGGEKVTGIETIDGVKVLFADESWLLFRQSGTEPMLRIYSEATSLARVKDLLDLGSSLPFEVS